MTGVLGRAFRRSQTTTRWRERSDVVVPTARVGLEQRVEIDVVAVAETVDHRGEVREGAESASAVTLRTYE